MSVIKHKLFISSALIASFAHLGFIASAGNKIEQDEQHERPRAVHGTAFPDGEMNSLKVQAAKSNYAGVNPLTQISETDMQETLLRMNDLSYNRVKGFLKFSVDDQEKLEKEGWSIKGFSGPEGCRSTFGDLSGIVCYNRQKNLITVIYHETANNKEDWENNFKGETVDSKKLTKEYRIDLYDEIGALLKAVPNKSDISELNDFLKSLKAKDFNQDNIAKVQSVVEKLTADGKIDRELSDDLLHAIRKKLELIDYIDETGANIKGEIYKVSAKKYYSTKKEVLSLLKDIIDTISEDQKDSVKIIFSGDKQARGLGSLALADVAANHGKELFGQGFNKQSSGKFYGYLLSAAQVGDKEYVNWMHKNVGIEQMLAQDDDHEKAKNEATLNAEQTQKEDVKVYDDPADLSVARIFHPVPTQPQEIDPETLVMKMNNFAYAVNKGEDFSKDDHQLMIELISDGWTMTPFMTKTGTANDQVESIGGVIATKDDQVIVATRGTVSNADWGTNIRAKKTTWQSLTSFFGFGNQEDDTDQTTANYFDGVNGSMATGNLQRHISSWDEISDQILQHAEKLGLEPNDLKITLTGHSQGAAQAHLNALNIISDKRFGFREKLAESFIGATDDLGMSGFYAPSIYAAPVNNGNLKVVAVEPPRVYGKQAAEVARNFIGENNITNIRNARDPVPMVPFAYMGFSHVGKMIDIDSGNYGLNPHYMKNIVEPALKALKEEHQAVEAAPAA